MKILVSGDGGNFEEATPWRSASRADVSYEETIVFDSPRMVKSLTISMKAPLAWGFYGISDVSLLSSGDENVMLVSGKASGKSERCLVMAGGSLGVADCLDAVAAGDGQEVFSLRDQKLVHVVSGQCAGMASAESTSVSFAACPNAEKGNDGQYTWQLNSKDQLTLRNAGASCLVIIGDKAVLRDCDDANRVGNAADTFLLAAVPEVNLNDASVARASAELLTAAVRRQREALSKLDEQLPLLATCKLGSLLQHNTTAGTRSSLSLDKLRTSASTTASSHREQDPAMFAIEKIFVNIGADVQDSLQVIRNSAELLKSAEISVAKSA